MKGIMPLMKPRNKSELKWPRSLREELWSFHILRMRKASKKVSAWIEGSRRNLMSQRRWCSSRHTSLFWISRLASTSIWHLVMETWVMRRGAWTKLTCKLSRKEIQINTHWFQVYLTQWLLEAQTISRLSRMWWPMLRLTVRGSRYLDLTRI